MQQIPLCVVANQRKHLSFVEKSKKIKIQAHKVECYVKCNVAGPLHQYFYYLPLISNESRLSTAKTQLACQNCRQYGQDPWRGLLDLARLKKPALVVAVRLYSLSVNISGHCVCACVVGFSDGNLPRVFEWWKCFRVGDWGHEIGF
ncbi:hypothetical protein ACOSP7_002621 [Xanthoceras sorbifolium]